MSRMGYDLFSRWGWKNLRHSLRFGTTRRTALKLLWRDSFGRFLCWFRGHQIYETGLDGGCETACSRCNRFVQSPTERN